MSKKIELKKQHEKDTKKQKIKTFVKVFGITFCSLALLTILSSLVYGQIASRPSSSTVCIRSKQEAEDRIKELPEVKKYLKKLNKQQQDSFVDIDMPMVTGNETKAGSAFLGQKSENNSRTLFAKYIFVTGCSSKVQKSKKTENRNFTALNFDYINKMALKTYSDETKMCMKDLTKIYQIDFDKDDKKDFLYGCVTGGLSNNIDYYLYKDNEGEILLLDHLTSSGNFEGITDFNKDGFPDIATSGIVMDEGDCENNQCYAPIEQSGGKYLLKRSYRHIWNQEKNLFNEPTKAEIYYIKDGKKITIKQ